MSDFVSHDMLTDLWDEILKRLWNYLETEESVQKLEERQKLETCLKEFLCIVPHDRKFFLPETAEVLRRTVRELEQFSANRGINAFESIFQYASNLFTKPWRKEYRVLKMYSGFYQHEVQSNLVDAIKLFEAMGYRQLNEDIMVLDGPICPDQMANVSRDAMAAYVECQIMKEIYYGLDTLNLDCTWQDVYNFREKHTGGASQAIKNLAYAIQEKKLRKDKNSTLDNFYSSVATTLQHQHQPQLATTANAHYQNCTHALNNHNAPPPPPPPLPQLQQQQQQSSGHYMPHNGACVMHPPQTLSGIHHNHHQQQQQQSQCNMHSSYNNNSSASSSNGKQLMGGYVQHHQHPHHYGGGTAGQAHMSHSRSLEQYNEVPSQPPLTPHRHSFDHQGCMATHHYQHPIYSGQSMHVYESPYDCVDSTAGSNASSYAMVAASPYNVSGNRYPLPYSISSQLNAHYATPATVTCNGIKGEPPYVANSSDSLYAKCNHQPPTQPPPPSVNRCNNSKDFHNYRQRSFPPDQHLIDFDDRAPLTTHDYHAHLHAITQNNSFDSAYEQTARQSRRAVNRMAGNYAQPRDVVCSRDNSSSVSPATANATDTGGTNMYDSYGYTRPIPRSSRNKTTTEQHHYARSAQESHNVSKALQQHTTSSLKANNNNNNNNNYISDDMSRRKSTDLLSTYDDFVTVGMSEKVRKSPTQAVKNQDGVGSFESWDFVYQNLERSGYTKDLGEREDLLVQSLDLNALQVGGNPGVNGATTSGTSSGETMAEKRRVTELKAGRENLEKLRTLERIPKAENIENRRNVSTTITTSNGVSSKKIPPLPTKSSLKATTTTTAGATSNHATATTIANQNHINGNINNNNNNNNNNNHNTNELILVAGKDVRRVPELSKRSPRNIQRVPTPVSTQVIVSSPNEWSCRFCTFLNPDTKRVCEMCCRSKDFNIEASASHAPTCV